MANGKIKNLFKSVSKTLELTPPLIFLSLPDRTQSYEKLLGNGHTAVPPSKAPLPADLSPEPAVQILGVTDPCACLGAMCGDVCYATLAAAIQQCEGGLVKVGGSKTVTSPVYFDTSFTYAHRPR